MNDHDEYRIDEALANPDPATEHEHEPNDWNGCGECKRLADEAREEPTP